MIIRKQILIIGRVQGVGCRPYINRLANELSLTGFVFNDTKGVTVEVQGDKSNVDKFTQRLKAGDSSVPLMHIVSCSVIDIATVENESDFVIVQSNLAGNPVSHVTFDSATCADCLRELNDPNNFRYRYPFINCTNCGPRYSIVKTIPYDRYNTTMDSFKMCDKCKSQYTDINDRRFHAQPIACHTCGPKIWLTDNAGNTIETDCNVAITKTAELLKAGKVVAIKGLGGFHLVVDAMNEAAVKLLRKRKQRDHKPFALMAANIEVIKQFCIVDSTAEEVLKSPQSPVVLLKKNNTKQVAAGVADDLNTLGFMLCYTPLHHMLFAEEGIEVLVMTSANISDEPLICDNDIAIKQLGNIADAFLMHNRDIYRQVDDSVVHIVNNNPALLRRSRGYVPSPILSNTKFTHDVFAAGADLKNTFCFAKDNQFILSEHIGDLDNAKVYKHYTNSIKHLQQLFEVQPKVIACDLHPGYMSTQFAIKLAQKTDAKLVQVQHHWAHIASVLAEYNYTEKVIGLVADGTGYGTDGAIWGGECLVASLHDFERFGYFRYFDLPGGDLASKMAIRPLMGLVGVENIEKYSEVLQRIETDCEKIAIIEKQLQTGLNSQKSSSFGRLFDSVAAVCGIGAQNNFEAELAMKLESATSDDFEGGVFAKF